MITDFCSSYRNQHSVNLPVGERMDCSLYIWIYWWEVKYCSSRAVASNKQTLVEHGMSLWTN